MPRLVENLVWARTGIFSIRQDLPLIVLEVKPCSHKLINAIWIEAGRRKTQHNFRIFSSQHFFLLPKGYYTKMSESLQSVLIIGGSGFWDFI